MKVLVFSDSHGRLQPMEAIIRAHADTTDAVLHLGDGAAEVLTLRAKFRQIPFHAVTGNCDSYTFSEFGITQDQCLVLGGYTLYLCHGDRFGVGGGTSALAAYAAYKNADIALYGHTHMAHDEYIPADPGKHDSKPLWILSPGSVSKPRDSMLPSFGILDLTEKGVLFSVGHWSGSANETARS